MTVRSEMIVGKLPKSAVGRLRELFAAYEFRNYQLHQTGILKEEMVSFLESDLGQSGSKDHSVVMTLDGRVEGLAAFQQLPWLSAHLQTETYRVRHIVASDLLSAGDIQNALQQVLKAIRIRPCRVFMRLPSNDSRALRALQDAGFRVVCNELNLLFQPDVLESDEEDKRYNVSPLAETDLAEACELAADGHQESHFLYAGTPRRDFQEMMRESIIRYSRSSGYETMVLSEEGNLAGLIALGVSPRIQDFCSRKLASAEFVVVRPSRRRQRCGSALLRTSLDHLFHLGCHAVAAKTVSSNYGALKLVLGAGARIVGSSMMLHWESQ